MFYTLFDLQEKEKKEKEKQKNNDKNASNFKKDKTPEDNYYGKGNKAYEYYNKKKAEDNNEKFEKTKNKIKLVVYQNGFILNDGPFRDRSIPENNKFMEEVEKGNIPEEITDKGITDLGILLINRKTEIYYPPIPITPITQITQITQINPINPITVNPINNFNQINQFNQNKGIDLLNYQYPYQQQYPQQYPQQLQQQYPQQLPQQYPYQFQNAFGQVIVPRARSNTQVWQLPPQTPIGSRNIRNNIFIPMTDNRNEMVRINRNTSSVPKKDKDKNNSKKTFQTFHNFKQMEYLKEEEEKKKKQKEKAKKGNINKKNIEKEKEEKEKEKEQKFTAFGGEGKHIGNVNVEGLNVNKGITNDVDIYKPVCSISIRLFNGEIVKCDFNYTQTLREIYYYVRRISGSNNFTLLDGFPPKPLNDYDKTIGELKLENTTLTQRIN